MKKSIKTLAHVILTLILVYTCSSDDNNNQSPESNEPEEQQEERMLQSILIASSKTYLVANTIDTTNISYTFKDQNNTNFNEIESDSIRNLIKLDINGSVVSNVNELVSQSTPIEFNLQASVGDISSNVLKVPSYNVEIELSSSQNFLYANGKANITFEKNFVSEQNISINEDQLSLVYNDNVLIDYTFSTEVEGSYNFKLKSGSIESNEIVINASEAEDLFEEIKIPIVFHVVPLEGTEIGEIGNPTNERIQRGIDMLNSLFSSTYYDEIENPRVINDVSNHLLAAGNISFYLPEDPQFDSPGIIRYPNNTPTTSNIADLRNFVQSNILDTYDYINIYVYPLQGLDFASHRPGTTSDIRIPGLPIVNEDYKPMEYIKIWPNIHWQENLEFSFGVLLAHEIGHYLGLYHVFKSNGYNLPINSCNQYDSDYVSDTYEYDRNKHLHNNVSGESETMRLMCNGFIEEANNVMDYYFADWYPYGGGYENMFTHQQMARMYSVLRTSPVRKQLSKLSQNRTTNKYLVNDSNKEVVY